ncbi:serine/threonine protein kinase, partial [Lujinxingia vulgaris]
YCWGSTIYGQLGHSSASDVSFVSNLPNVQHISAGTDHTCAIADGVAYCWGDENRGKLGHSSSNTVPNAVSGGHNDWTDIAAGNEHTCGIAAGTLFCWGHNLVGQLGRGGLGGATPTEVDWAFAR